MHAETKSVSLCIIGKPNAGKSTLLNRIIGEKISIVTPKVQTTRSIITGIVTLGDTQLIIFDTPGIFEPKKGLEKAMVRCAWSSLSSADVIVVIIDSSAKIDSMMRNIIERVRDTAGKKIVFLLNKIDLKSRYYVENMCYVEKVAPNAKIFNISAINGNGVETLINHIKSCAVSSKWDYDEDEITNLPSRFLASEITREQLFLQMHQELPYNLFVECEMWNEQKDGSVKINQLIIVGKDTHKNMIIGKHGAQIRSIGSAARVNIETLLGKKVHLFLFVKVSPHSMDKMSL